MNVLTPKKSLSSAQSVQDALHEEISFYDINRSYTPRLHLPHDQERVDVKAMPDQAVSARTPWPTMPLVA
jgi:hypothetical protein